MKKVQFIHFAVLAMMAVSISLFTTSCKKEGCTDEHATNYDSEADEDDGSCKYPDPVAEFSISSPTAGATFMAGETVHIDAMITYDGEIHGYELYLRNMSMDGAVVFEEEGHDHDSPVHVHAMWEVDVMHHSDMELEIRLITDHDGGYESETVSFHCHPMM